MNKKEKASKMLTEAVKNRLKLCLFNLINDATLDDDDSLPDNFKALKKEVFKIFSELPSAIKSADSDREPLFSRLSDLQVEVIRAGLPVYALSNYFRAAEDTINREEGTRNASEGYDEMDSPEEIIHVVEHFIDGELNGNEEEAAFCRDIISMVPCTMSKVKFADYIAEAFKLSDNPEDYYFYKLNFLPFAFAEGREAFPELFENMDNIMHTSINKISDDELTDLGKLLPVNEIDIFSYTDCISMMYSDINYMFALLLYSIDVDFVTDGDMVNKDIFYSAAELSAKENLDEIDIELKRQTNERSEEILNDLYENKQTNPKDNEVLKKVLTSGEYDDGEIANIVNVYNRTSAYFLTEAENGICRYLALADTNKCETSDDAAKRFTAEFEKATASFAPAVKKSLRRDILADLSCPLSTAEILDYVEAVLERYYGKPGYGTVFEGVNMAMNMHDKSYMRKFFENLKDFRPHDDDCGCGCHDHEHHHHHHDDGCSCGCHDHEHHHHHD